MTIKRIILASIFAGGMGILFTVIGISSGRIGASQDGQHLEGAFIVTSTILGDPKPPFKSLATITRDGSFTESLQPGLNPLVSDVHGVWSRTGNRQFATTGVYLRSDAAGNFLGTTKVRAAFSLDETLNEGNAQFQADLFDPAGNLVGSFDGTSHVTRIQLEPLE